MKITIYDHRIFFKKYEGKQRPYERPSLMNVYIDNNMSIPVADGDTIQLSHSCEFSLWMLIKYLLFGGNLEIENKMK